MAGAAGSSTQALRNPLVVPYPSGSNILKVPVFTLCLILEITVTILRNWVEGLGIPTQHALGVLNRTAGGYSM